MNKVLNESGYRVKKSHKMTDIETQNRQLMRDNLKNDYNMSNNGLIKNRSCSIKKYTYELPRVVEAHTGYRQKPLSIKFNINWLN